MKARHFFCLLLPLVVHGISVAQTASYSPVTPSSNFEPRSSNPILRKPKKDKCKPIIPNHEALAFPEGLMVYYPGQQIRSGVPGNPIIEQKRDEFLARKSPGGQYEVSTKKRLSAAFSAKVLSLFKGEASADRIRVSEVELKNIYKILGTTDDIFAQHNDALIVQNVLIADVIFTMETKDTTKAGLEYIQQNMASQINASISEKVESGGKIRFSASDIVVGLQAAYVENMQTYTHVVSNKSTSIFKLTEVQHREVLIIPSDKAFGQVSEVVMRFAPKASSLKNNMRILNINIHGTGPPIAFTKELDMDNLSTFSAIVPASGQGSEDIMIVYTFDPVQEQDNENSYRIVVNRTMKRITNVKSGLELLCK